MAATGFALASLLAGAAAATVWEGVAERAGVRFQTAGEVHSEGDVTWPALPEVFGAGACWFDADGDGFDDLYLANQQFNRHNPSVGPWADELDPHSQLFLSGGDGSFTDASAEAGVDTRAFAYGCSAADYDGDGCVDLFVSVFGGSELYRNDCDGTFANVTAQLGPPFGDPWYCDPERVHPCMATSSAWADYDRDGDLDLYVGTYVNTNLTDVERRPGDHVAQLNWLLRNGGDGTFAEVAREAGVAGNPTDGGGTKTLGVVWTDYDRDGWPDLYVANDLEPNHLFRNQGDGTFRDVAPEAGVADDRASMGVAAADYDNDGWPDLYMTHYEGEHNGFYRNKQDGTFEDRSGEDDLARSWDDVGWGTAFVDVDRDGWLDLVVVNGHTEWSADNYSQPLRVFRSAPNPAPDAPPWDRDWTDVTLASGTGAFPRRVHRGAAFGDADLDGDLEVALGNNGNQSAELLRGGGVERAWLNVRLAQPGANRFGVGARVVLEAGGVAQAREVQTGTSYLSQNTLTQEFGVGAATRADRITVAWPDGGTTSIGPVAANQTIRIERGGAWTNDTVSPRTRTEVAGTPGNGGWWRSPVRVDLVAEDRGTPFPSGVATTRYALGGGPWRDAAGAPLALGEGVHDLRFRSVDRAGNSEPPRGEVVRVDATLPEASPTLHGVRGASGWWTTPVKVALEARDALSGVAEVRYRVDDGPWKRYGGPIALRDDGRHHLDYQAEDVAGNAAPVARLDVAIDTTPPSVAFLRPAPGSVQAAGQALGAAGAGPAVLVHAPGDGPVRVQVRAEDASSGVAVVAFWVDGVVQGSSTAPPHAWDWDVAGLAPGPHRLRAVAADVAGSRASADAEVVVVQLPAPVAELPDLTSASTGERLAAPAAGAPTPKATCRRASRSSESTPWRGRGRRRRG